MKKNIITFSIIFLSAVFVFNEINRMIIEERISNVKYTDAKLQKFMMIGKNSDSFIMKGSEMIDRESKIFIINFDLNYFKDKEHYKITADKGTYLKKESVLKLFNNVTIRTSDITLYTEKLDVHTKEKIAENKEDVLIKTEKMTTTGKNIRIDLKNEKILLKNVKTVIRGS